MCVGIFSLPVRNSADISISSTQEHNICTECCSFSMGFKILLKLWKCMQIVVIMCYLTIAVRKKKTICVFSPEAFCFFKYFSSAVG